MIVSPLRPELTGDLERLMALGGPHLRPRTSSDYWLYARLFSSTCPVAFEDGAMAGAVIAFRSQDDPADVYVQDVLTHPDFRRRGVARTLLDSVRARAADWGCHRLYLTSEPGNFGAHRAWRALGFRNVPGDRDVEGVQVITDFKGPGRDRAVYELLADGPP
ncbi:GNAT family N-acetyltransferase [Micromonospora humi]|uniref:Acetyltransferase (GNAT) family protein n=1 Tax=Micromonospora humi TaxID=745366 RepID=A0A1C5H4W3_9ACTN|nr:GNAT family N-acetyltransferase [Micromonospora humi]SCG41044.1 Acetyltransferase (GNAT) family protein [Micromonospora humi]